MPKMALKKEVLGWLITTRLRHGHFADYHERFGHKEENIYYKCCQRRSKAYPFSYSSVKVLRVKLFSIKNRSPLISKEVLGIVQGIKMFAEWALKTELFTQRKKLKERKKRNRSLLGGQSV